MCLRVSHVALQSITRTLVRFVWNFCEVNLNCSRDGMFFIYRSIERITQCSPQSLLLLFFSHTSIFYFVVNTWVVWMKLKLIGRIKFSSHTRPIIEPFAMERRTSNLMRRPMRPTRCYWGERATKWGISVATPHSTCSRSSMTFARFQRFVVYIYMSGPKCCSNAKVTIRIDCGIHTSYI